MLVLRSNVGLGKGLVGACQAMVYLLVFWRITISNIVYSLHVFYILLLYIHCAIWA